MMTGRFSLAVTVLTDRTMPFDAVVGKFNGQQQWDGSED